MNLSFTTILAAALLAAPAAAAPPAPVAPAAPTPASPVAAAAPAPAPATGTDTAERVAVAAEKAAAAAQVAAEAAQKAAEAAAAIAARPVPGVAVVAAGTAAPPPSKWSGTAGLGLLSLTGNSRSVTFNANAAAQRKSDGWILGLKATGVYGQSRVPEGTTTQVLAKAAGGQARMDRKFHDRYSGYLLGALETDHVKSVEIRYTAEAGASLTWVDASGGGDDGWKAMLRTDLGFRWAQEQRFQYYPPAGQSSHSLDAQTLYAPRLGLAFRYAIDKNVLFTEDAEIFPNVVGAGRVIVNSTSKLTSRLSSTLSLGASFQVNHDSKPAPGKVPTDTILGLTVEVLL